MTDDALKEFWYTHVPELNLKELLQFFPMYEPEQVKDLIWDIDAVGEIFWTIPLITFVHAITNPFDKRSITTICKEHDKTVGFHRDLLKKNLRYKNAYNRLIKEGAKEAEGEIFRKLISDAASGVEKARENFLKMSGYDLAQKMVITNTGDRVLENVIMVLQRHLDPESLKAVAIDLKEIETARELPPPGRNLF